MRAAPILIATAFVVAVTTGTAQAQSWYDHYDAGLAAVRKGDWKTAADRMAKAIAANPKENNRARAYGTIFYNYHPYYYRGVANMNLGNYQEAVADLEKTTGPGPENLGSIDSLIQMAKTHLAQSTAPPPVPQPQVVPPPAPQPQPVVPAPVPQPVRPVIDAALRSRAQAAVQEARRRLEAAQERDATGTRQYQQALAQFTEANTRLATARSNDDLNAVVAMADNAGLIADSAVAPRPVPTRPTAVTETVMADSSRRVRMALESYFRGEFEEASELFGRLAQDMPTNGWIWAFLGASQYSRYAFEADEQYRAQALDAFRKARQYGNWGRDGLPSKYFSRRIRNAFNDTAG
ncbi:MAG TPA: hypothetical protein VM779_05625 [Thermoanaerobaculia bacterium]|nr:hypothetical protein [Thermoanaerobaculia bacterium]